jgi:hypothetical protein
MTAKNLASADGTYGSLGVGAKESLRRVLICASL